MNMRASPRPYDLDALNHVMGDGDVASGADLVVVADDRTDFYRAITRMPQVAGVASRDDTVAAFRSAVADVLTIEMTFFLGFAAAIAFGVAYNISRIALADRARDLATLRVLGFAPVECAYILVGELLFLALLATPVGVAGGLAIVKAMVVAFGRQDFYLPFMITANGLGWPSRPIWAGGRRGCGKPSSFRRRSVDGSSGFPSRSATA